MIFDICIVVVLLLFAIYGKKKGFFKSLVGLLSVALSAVVSCFCCEKISVWVYDLLFKQQINKSITSFLTSSLMGDDVFNHLSDGVIDFLKFFGVTNQELNKTIDSSYQVTGNIVESLELGISSTIINILNFIFIIALFILGMFVFRLILKSILPVFELPLLKQVNGLLGFLLGLIKGAVFVVVVILILKLLAVNEIFFLNNEIINQSNLLVFLYNNQYINNIFMVINP